MESKGDDCYYFYYSSCTKGDTCPYRHEEAALGSEVVCNLWQEDRCFRKICKFRHMEIMKDRKNIPCYWEGMPGGCQKPHCVFMHSGQAVQSNAPAPQGMAQQYQQAEQVPDWGQVSVAHANSPIGTDPSAATVPSAPITPKVEQFVINPFDEETDEESIVGTPVKKPPERQKEVVLEGAKVLSLKAPSRQWISPEEETGEPMGFEIKSLEEIRREKIAKARQSIEDADFYITPSTETNLDIVESEPKKIKLASSGTKTGIEVKSLEEIRREKALQSLKAAQKAKAKSKLLVGEKAVTKKASEKKEISRRIIVSSKDESAPVKPSLKTRLGVPLKHRLGPQTSPVTENKVSGSTTNVKVNIKDRLGASVTRKISLTKKKERSSDNLAIKSLTELKEQSRNSQGNVEVSSLDDLRKRVENKEASSHRVIVRSNASEAKRRQGSAKKIIKVTGGKGEECPIAERTRPTERKEAIKVRNISPRKPREPKTQIYKPPALKRKVSQDVELAVITEDDDQPVAKKPTKWGAKTFSEIMKEKQLKLREQQATNQDNLEFKAELKDGQKPRRAFSPVKFQTDNNAADEKRKPAFKPIVFDLDKKETVVKTKVKRKAIVISGTDSGPKLPKHSVRNVKSAMSSEVPAMEEELPDSPKISISPTAKVAEEGDTRKSATTPTTTETPAVPYKLVKITPSKSSPKKISLSRPASQSSENPPARRRSHRSSGSVDNRKPSTSGEKSAGSSEKEDFNDTDILDKALEEFLGDDDIEVTEADHPDDDDLLQEMEELLA